MAFEEGDHYIILQIFHIAPVLSCLRVNPSVDIRNCVIIALITSTEQGNHMLTCHILGEHVSSAFVKSGIQSC